MTRHITHFGIAETLHAAGERVPASWEFRPGAGSSAIGDEWPDSEWFELLEEGTCTADDLRHVGDVLCRYTRLLKLHDRDY